MDARQPARAAISVVVTRADGTVEDMGVVAYGDSDPERQRAYDEALARGERIDELDLIPHGEMAPIAPSITFSGQAVG